MNEEVTVSEKVLNIVGILLVAVITAVFLLSAAAFIGSVDVSPGSYISSGEVHTIDGSFYLDRTGNPTVVGALDNDVGEPITNVEIEITFFEDGEEVATHIGSPPVGTIPDSTQVPFEIRGSSDIDPDDYEVRFSYETAETSPGMLSVIDASTISQAQDSVIVVGDAQNDMDETVDNPRALATFYDSSGNVIGVRTDSMEGAEPGEISEFHVRYSTLGDVPSNARSYDDFSVVVIDEIN